MCRPLRLVPVLTALSVASGAAALARPVEPVTLTSVPSNGPLNSSANGIRTATLAGGYQLGRMTFAGTLTSLTPATWLIDSRILITAPSGQTMTYQPFTSGTTFSTEAFSASRYLPATIDPAGEWTFRFYELVDNGGTALVDARWDITVTFTDELPTPPEAVDLGDILFPGQTSSSNPLAANTVVWHRFTLDREVSAANSSFLDLTTNGSELGAMPPDDTEIALYNSAGVLVSFDEDGGPGLTGQLSFGMGSRIAVGDGVPLNGQDGTLPAGTYYVAVGSHSMIRGETGFAVSSGSGISGTVVLSVSAGQDNQCRADWNDDDFVNSQDFFDFLGDFFSGNADFNHDQFTNSQDFFDFLTEFFQGC